MSYSRWGRNSHWYTFWCCQDEKTENRDTAIFDICCVKSFTAKNLRTNLEGCLDEVRKIDSKGDVDELRTYIKAFLADVDERYPLVVGWKEENYNKSEK